MYDPNDPFRRSMFDPTSPTEQAARQQREAYTTWWADFQESGRRRRLSTRRRRAEQSRTASWPQVDAGQRDDSRSDRATGHDGVPVTGAIPQAPTSTPQARGAAAWQSRPPGATHRLGRRLLVLLAAVCLCAVSSLVTLYVTDASRPAPSVRAPAEGTPTAMRLATNVRTGPSTSFGVVALLGAGAPVTVDCVENGWVRLSSPHPGHYVFAERLDLPAAVSPC